MKGPHGPIMPGIHGLKEIECLRTAHLADDDPLGTHTQAVFHEITHGDLALAFQVRRPGFKTHDVRLLKLKLRRVLTGNDSFVLVDIARQAV